MRKQRDKHIKLWSIESDQLISSLMVFSPILITKILTYNVFWLEYFSYHAYGGILTFNIDTEKQKRLFFYW